jgi:superfamily II DNA helicase RecQ
VSMPIDDAALHSALERYFHYPAFRPGQLDALMRDGTALVISPLVALMKDQADSLTRRGSTATHINSTLTVAEQDRRIHALASNQSKIVLVAAERFRRNRIKHQRALA